MRTRRGLIFLGSLVFYGWSEPVFLGVVLLSAFLDWMLAKVIDRKRGSAPGIICLWLGVLSNLGLLVYAKYTVFAVSNLNFLFELTALPTLTVPEILLPLGISFIVFEKITYLVDIHRKIASPSKSLLDYLNYVLLFPKILAGPIVKYHDIASQLNNPSPGFADFQEGIFRFVKGLAKKVLLADQLAAYSDAAFAAGPSSLSFADAWLGIACFSLQVYFDFSGYSDMAIGMCRMCGFRLSENFNHPYLANSVTEFWKRWHISLTSWVREYIYIPLGGNRVPAWKVYRNLGACFLLSGIWHGASWTFVIWGCLHGGAMIIEKILSERFRLSLPTWLAHLATLVFLVVTWVFFRSPDLNFAGNYLLRLAGFPPPSYSGVEMGGDQWFFLGVSLLVVACPLFKNKFEFFSRQPIRAAAMFGLCLLCCLRLAVADLNPFLYFRF